MSDLTAIDAPRRPPATYITQVVRETVSAHGAQVGLLWIGVVAFCAVFAPLLASSHPLLMKMDGAWSSPWLKHLAPADVALPLLALISVVLLRMKKQAAWIRWAWFLALSAAMIAICAVFVSAPRAVSYDRYRLDAERIEWVLHAPVQFSPSDRLRDQTGPDVPKHPWPPDAAHWMGTDANGADILSRMIHACRIAMAVGFIATGIALIIGIGIGGLMGYFSGVVDLIGMRIVEIFSAIPTFFLLLTFVAFFDRNLYMMMIIIGITGWVGYARFIRAEFFKLRQQDYVQAARACALPLRSILFRHMLPNGVAPVLVEASFGVASAILFESTLSFLGLGLVDEPSWGQMLNQATRGGNFYWWLASFPGLAIFMTVFAYNLVGEALRDAIDPQSKRSAHL
ncbi:MAG: ABC transporter permease [Phycisphaeraceae bacterium]|nr:ABC transporter permease [Phycisphaeraceae bacterium]